MGEEQDHLHENHSHHSHACETGRVSKRDRVIMLFLVIIPVIFLFRPFIAFQSFSRANSFLDAGFYKEAIHHYQRSIVLKQNFWEAYSWLGFAYQKEGQIEKSIDAYKKAIKLNPNDKQVCLELGLLYYRKKNFSKSACYFNKVVQIDPSDLNTKNLEALSYEKLGKEDKAASIWKEILKSDPSFRPAIENLERIGQ